MTAELGHIALILAFCVALLQSVIPMVGAQRNDARMMEFGDRAALGQFVLVAFSFAALTSVFLNSDFSVKLAALHSHSDKPLLYKITGVWGNHEGSILLWVLMMAGYGAFVPVLGKTLPPSLKARAIAVQALVSAGFLAFILFTSNPFERLNPVPVDGNGLNPILQDPGLAFHPPFLYLGYVGFSLPFSFAVAALIEGRVDAVWAKWLRPWVLIAWSFLTIGIALGSFWAYYELGWGGWWMWDPVENVSFMPWLAGTALLHSILVLGTRHSLANWTVLLAITTFALSLIGTFVVRSGILVSVHAFAVDPERGVFLLLLLSLATGGALTLYALRANTLRDPAPLNLTSRDGALVMNNLLLIAALATVFLGTFYPLLIDAVNGSKISVGAPYFDLTFAPIMCLLILFMGIGPMFKWRQDSLQRLRRPMLICAVGFGVIFAPAALFGKSVLGAAALALAAWLAIGTGLAIGRKARWSRAGLKAQPASTWGFAGAHMGLAIFTAAVTAMTVWAETDIGTLKRGDSLTLGKYTYTLTEIGGGQRDNYDFLAGEVFVTKNNKPITTLSTERRFYPVRNQITTEAGLHLSFGQTLFASIGEGNPEDGFIVQVYRHPFVVWIWLGALLMALAGFVSLADRRLRLPSRRRKPAGASLSPAE
jgi:cytochrome c-type biogenesis protein CcmF